MPYNEPVVHHESREDARLFTLAHGWNSTCYQILNPGIKHWWSADRQSLVGYVQVGRTAIVAGAPVCPEAALVSAVQEWSTYAAVKGWRVCFFGAEQRLKSCMANQSGFQMLSIGSQPEWHPSEFVRAIEGDVSLRAQLNRAKNKGVTVSEWSRDAAEGNPELQRVLDTWLKTKGLPTLHFLVEPETLSDLRDRRIFVAERAGSVVGFVTLCPVPAREGWLTEQFVRSPDAPNGTIELVLYHAAKAVEQAGSNYFTMGIVPFADHGGASPAEPLWLRFVRSWLRAHYIRFYNFRGLDEFKTKFHPTQWQAVVVIVQDTKFRFRHLRAIARAFTVGPPELAVAIGCWKALVNEGRKFLKFVRRLARA